MNNYFTPRALFLWVLIAFCANVSFAQSSPIAEAAARANSAQLEQTVIFMKVTGFSAETIQGVLALSNFVTEKRAAGGMAPEEEVFLSPVQPVQPNGAGLEQMITGGNKLPKKSFFELTQQDTLTADNYAKVIDALYDPADMDLWLSKRDGGAMNAQERADQKETLASGKTRWLKKYAELVNTGQQEIADKWFRLFNTLVQKAIHGSREEFRRGLIAAHSMASYSTITQDKLNFYAPATATQSAELVLMQEPTSKIIQIERRLGTAGDDKSTVKYLVASDAQLASIGFPDGVGATLLALKIWRINQENVHQTNSRIAMRKSRIAELESKATQLESKATQLESKATQLDALAAMLKRINDLGVVILKQNEKLKISKSDTAFVRSLYANLDAIVLASQDLREWEKQNQNHPGIAKRRKEVDELIGLLQQTTNANALGYGVQIPKGK